MLKNQKGISMGFVKETFPAGTHMCMIYTDEEERRKIISKFLDSGLKTGEQVYYLADVMSPEEVRDWLVSMDVDIPQDGEANGFNVLVAEDTYCPNGRFVPDEMLDTLRDCYNQAIDQGYPGSRVSGEMSWALKGIPGSERLMEYESLVNNVFVTHPMTAICQYNANLFDGATILNVLKVHPMMIVRGQIVRNPYYMKPEEFISEFVSECKE
jgi:hypothetical protein